MIKGTRVQRNTAVLNQIRKELPERTEELVVRMATDMEHEFAKNARRDTNAMAESVYTQTSHGAYKNGSPTTVAAVESRARTLNPDAEMSPSPTPRNRTTAYIKPVVSYYAYQEFGTDKIKGSFAMARGRKAVQAKLKSEYAPLFKQVVTAGHK